jgi:alpha-tubulin suppressor-like RCC1 family protein
MCGRNEKGQLGLGTFSDEYTPYYITRVPDKVTEVAAGDQHSVVLTFSGEVYTMGDNSRG